MPQLSISLLSFTLPPPTWLLPTYPNISFAPLLVHTVCSMHIHPPLVLSHSRHPKGFVFPKTLCPFLQPIQTPTITQYPVSPLSLGFLLMLHPASISPLHVYWLLLPVEFGLALHSVLTQGRL